MSLNYTFRKEPILTHVLIRCLSLKTKKGCDINYWKLLINKIEKNQNEFNEI